MKSYIVIIVLLISFYKSTSAQISTVFNFGEYYSQFKASKTYFVKTGNLEFDLIAEKSLKEVWKITPFELIDSKELDKNISDKSASFILFILDSMGTYDDQKLFALGLINGGEKKITRYVYGDLIAYSPINSFAGESKITDCKFRIRNMLESMIHVIDIRLKNNIKASSRLVIDKLTDIYCKRSPEIKKRTLLVCNEQIKVDFKEKTSQAITKEQFATIYPHKFEFVDQTFLAEVIENKSKDYYYLQICISGNKNIFVFDPSDGEVLYFSFGGLGMELREKDVYKLAKMVDRK